MQDPAAETLGQESLSALEKKLGELANTVTARLKKQVLLPRFKPHGVRPSGARAGCRICGNIPGELRTLFLEIAKKLVIIARFILSCRRAMCLPLH